MAKIKSIQKDQNKNVKSFRTTPFTVEFLKSHSGKMTDSSLINLCIEQASTMVDPEMRLVIAKSLISYYDIVPVKDDNGQITRFKITNTERLAYDKAESAVESYKTEILELIQKNDPSDGTRKPEGYDQFVDTLNHLNNLNKPADSESNTSSDCVQEDLSYFYDISAGKRANLYDDDPLSFFYRFLETMSYSDRQYVRLAAEAAQKNITDHPEYAFLFFAEFIREWGESRTQNKGIMKGK